MAASRTKITGSSALDGTEQHLVVLFSNPGSVTTTLPAASSQASGDGWVFKDETGTTGSLPWTIARAGSDTIDGATSIQVRNNFQSLCLYSDGVSKWFVIQVFNVGAFTWRVIGSGTTAISANATVTLGTFTRLAGELIFPGGWGQEAVATNDFNEGANVLVGTDGVCYAMQRTTNTNEFTIRARNFNLTTTRTLDWIVMGCRP